MYLVYKTDNLHSFASRDVIGVCTKIGIAYNVINQQAKKEGCGINTAQDHNLRSYKQTQGYRGDGEFVIEEVKTNILI